jgi:NAD(P)-dependent dehydrogenase (short-subunit alcohol dehydrogenase family)
MPHTFENRHIVVTGGAGALGSEVCSLLLYSGAKVSIPAFSDEELENFEYREHPNLYAARRVNLADEDQASGFYRQAVDQQGALWASIHIAGGFGMGKIADTELKDFRKQLDMNLVTCFNCSKAAVRHMRSNGAQGGRIVNIAARPALEPREGAGMTAYATAKAGVAAFTVALAQELAGENILVNAIAPSIIDTEANRKSMPDADHSKWPKPEELARQIVMLISPSNTVTRGSIITVYGRS